MEVAASISMYVSLSVRELVQTSSVVEGNPQLRRKGQRYFRAIGDKGSRPRLVACMAETPQ